MDAFTQLRRGRRAWLAAILAGGLGTLVACAPAAAPSPTAAPAKPAAAKPAPTQAAAKPAEKTEAKPAAKPAANVQQVTLKLASAFQRGTAETEGMDIFLKLVEERAKDYFRIQFVGGPEAFPPFNLVEATRSGAVDIQNSTTAFYTAQNPALGAAWLIEMPLSEQRQTGVTDWMARQHEKIGLHYLGRTTANEQFRIYTTRQISGADLSGLVIRTTPVYKPMLEALGAQTITTAPGEVYTALERGVVQGYGWPEVGIIALRWHEVTKFIVEPGFYQVETSLVMNKSAWDKLPKSHQEKLNEIILEMEKQVVERFGELKKTELQRLTGAGLQVIELKGADREKWLKTAEQAGWAEAEKNAPADVKELRSLIEKARR